MYAGRSSQTLSVTVTISFSSLMIFQEKHDIFLETEIKSLWSIPEFKATVEKKSGHKIKAMRFDRGGEFTSNEFQEFCEAHGIRRPMTVPRSPQQNGVAERKNNTILDIA